MNPHATSLRSRHVARMGKVREWRESSTTTIIIIISRLSGCNNIMIEALQNKTRMLNIYLLFALSAQLGCPG